MKRNRASFLAAALAAALAAPAPAQVHPRHKKPRTYKRSRVVQSAPRKKIIREDPALATVSRGTLEVVIKAKGTVRAEELLRIRSTIDGRVESVTRDPGTWAVGGREVGFLLNKELAALIDAKQSIPSKVMEERWKRIYKRTPIQCPDDCFVLKIFAQPGKWITPGTLLVEAARRLRLVGRVRPGDTHWISEGQILTYWDAKNPRKKIQGRVERFVLDTQGELVNPGGTFTILLDPGNYLDPGTEWEGEIQAVVRPNALRVPTRALITHNGETFLPVRVSTGITTYDVTEITAGTVDGTQILLLDPKTAGGLRVHEPLGRNPAREEAERKRAESLRRKKVREGAGPSREKGRRDDRMWEDREPVRRPAEPIDGFLGPDEGDPEDRFPSDLQ